MWGAFIIVAVLIGMFLIGLLLLVIYLPVKDWLNAGKAWFSSHLTAGVFIYIGIVTVSIMLLLPSSMVEIFGVIIAGPWIGAGWWFFLSFFPKRAQWNHSMPSERRTCRLS